MKPMNKFEAFLAKLWKDKLEDFAISLVGTSIALAYAAGADYFYHKYLNAHGFGGKIVNGFFTLLLLHDALEILQHAWKKDE